jgi:uncharacterized protein with GYD domain
MKLTNPEISQEKKAGKVISAYWTIGRYDAIVTLEAPSERVALKLYCDGRSISAVKR